VGMGDRGDGRLTADNVLMVKVRCARLALWVETGEEQCTFTYKGALKTFSAVDCNFRFKYSTIGYLW